MLLGYILIVPKLNNRQAEFDPHQQTEKKKKIQDEIPFTFINSYIIIIYGCIEDLQLSNIFMSKFINKGSLQTEWLVYYIYMCT